MKTIILLASNLLFFCADTALFAAPPSPVTCGAILSRKKFTLAADLDCGTSQAPIAVRDRAQLDLNGHALRIDVANVHARSL
jgi:hypothetical protein